MITENTASINEAEGSPLLRKRESILGHAAANRLACATLALAVSLSVMTGIQSIGLAFADEADLDAALQTEEVVPTADEIELESLLVPASSAQPEGNSALAYIASPTLEENVAVAQASAVELQRSEKIEALIEQAEALIGTPYVYGGTTPSGFDCSGFTKYVFKHALDMELPRSAAAQSGLGDKFSIADAERGDLVFWGNSGVYHVGIYLGDGMYVHAAASGSVKVQSTASYCPSFAKRLF